MGKALTALAPAILHSPATIVFGEGSIQSVAPISAGLGERAFIVADPAVAEHVACRMMIDQLDSSMTATALFTNVVPELPTEFVRATVDLARRFSPDVIVAIGGGSTIDLAKAVAIMLRNPGNLADYYGEGRLLTSPLPVVAIPTTAGTGSEVTPVTVVTDPDRALKVGISDRRIVPAAAVIDPTLGYGVPPSTTAHSGIDALAHAVEAHTAIVRPIAWDGATGAVGANAIASSAALEAISLIGAHLPTATRDGVDAAARRGMSYGAMLAGRAFGSAGVHLAHALQYPIGALTHTPHGLGTGLLLPYVMVACFGSRLAELAQIGRALGVTADSSDEYAARGAIDRVVSLREFIGIPSTLAEIGIEQRHLEDIVRLASGVTRLTRNAPVSVTPDLLRRIVSSAFFGDLRL